MYLKSHRSYFLEEYFGSRMYNSKDQKEFYFNQKETTLIKKLLSGEKHLDPKIEKFKEDLINKGVLTSDITIIKNPQNARLSSPMKISLNFTKRCNLRCKHCLNNSDEKIDKGELTTEDYFKLFDQMRASGCFFITMGGGEPLLRKDLFEAIRYARKNDIAVSLVTNGLLITEEIAKKLNDLNLDTITISIDGLEENHEAIRGEGTFNKTIANAKILRRLCTTAKLSARVTVNSKNINEYREIINLGEEIGFDSIRFTPILLLGRTKKNSELLITQKQFIDFLKNINRVKSKIEIFNPNTVNGEKWFVSPENFGCHCGKEACWITQTGKFYPCIFFGEDYLAGNIKNESFIDLWKKSENMVELCGNPTCLNCSNYKICRSGCRARALWEYNDINAVDPLCPMKKNNI